ncbi:acyltransferase [Acinetobacter johnsonii]|uniref:acyltransferase n=1 Tax=Acinetobacter johnsonii TaxID=40214 RepID=UPI001327C8EA|nr:acyltransferase [Acinetobacter johnsonii]MWC18605.1 acyltransferase [Acinetobacter johnsonii]
MFFKLLELMSWITAQCRKQFYNLAFGTNFRYFGKNCSIEISGHVKMGKNVYIGDHVNLIVEPDAILEIGDNSFIGENCYIKCFGGKIEIGQDVSINSKSFLNGCGGLHIGNNTRIGTQTIIIASNHNFNKPDVLIREQGINKKGIFIGENIWLGARTTILDGVNISNNSVVGACSLVSKSLPEQGVYVGSPVRKIK